MPDQIKPGSKSVSKRTGSRCRQICRQGRQSIAKPVIAVGTVAAITPAICLTVTELITGKEAVAARLQEISAR